MESNFNLSNIKLRIFVALSACSCVYQHWMDKVFEQLIPIKENLDFVVEDPNGFLGNKHNIIQNTIMIEFKDKSSEPIFITNASELADYVKKIEDSR